VVGDKLSRLVVLSEREHVPIEVHRPGMNRSRIRRAMIERERPLPISRNVSQIRSPATPPSSSSAWSIKIPPSVNPRSFSVFSASSDLNRISLPFFSVTVSSDARY
jgi:hypothetical protein